MSTLRFVIVCTAVLISAASFQKPAVGLLPIVYPESNVIEYDSNVITNTKALRPFFKELDDFVDNQQDKVVISHIGDSHIQADFLTHTTRKLFQKTFGNGGRGFVFPNRLVRSNSALNLGIRHTGKWESCLSVRLRDKCNFGVTGATATTYDQSSSLALNPNKIGDMNYEFNRVKVFMHQTPLSYDLKFLSPDSTPLKVDQHHLSQTVSEVFFTEAQDSLWLTFDQPIDSTGYCQLYGLSFENNHPGLLYNAIGLNGAYAKSYLRNTFFDEQLAALNSNLIILSLGTNDAYMWERQFCKSCFKDYYETLLQKIVRSNPKATILLTTPGDFYIRRRYHNRNVGLVVQAIKEIATQYNLPLWDFNTIMGGSYAIKQWRGEGLAQNDLIHYTEKGYELQGKMLYRAIMDAYENQED